MGKVVKTYSYQRPDGKEFFQKVRWEPKAFNYRFQCDVRSGCDEGWHWTKPDGANGYLYRLPEVMAAVQDVWWAEGEKDADALADAGVVSTCHHQGAEVGASVRQAQWLGGVSRVVLVADRDSAGAWDVVRRYDLLLEVGVPVTRLVVVRAAGPLKRQGPLNGGVEIKDAADHLMSGRGIDDFVPVSMDRAREVAAQHRALRRNRKRGYDAGRKWGGG